MKTIMKNHLPVVGILGGGQLAKMLAQAACNIGVTTQVLVQKAGDELPCLDGKAVIGDWNDQATAVSFSQTVDVVTLENEFVNQFALEAIEKESVPLFPSLACISLIQDKWQQKVALMAAGIPVVPCRAVGSTVEVTTFAEEFGWPVVLKRRHMGYDGKGNATIADPMALPEAWARLATNTNGLFVEAFCPFEREIAVIVCRSTNDEVATYPVVDTLQENHICHVVRAPSSVPAHVADAARRLAEKAIRAVHGHGAMGVELFVTDDGRVLVNELAPRVHNSGHFTIEACVCSQFENHIRAILGLPLGSVKMLKPFAAMVNLLGEGDGPALPSGYERALGIRGAHVHVYGKAVSSKGRKMGHVTALGDTADEALEIAKKAAEMIHFGRSH